MKITLKLLLLSFCILIFTFPSGTSATAQEPNFVTEEQFQNSIEAIQSNMVTKEDLSEFATGPGQLLTREEITQVLIDMQKKRIELLEGNFNALLQLLGLIIGVLTLFAGIFVWFSRRAFSSKVEEVEKHLAEMKQLKNETIVKMEAVRELNSNLNVALREVHDLQINFNKSKISFDDGTERIKQLAKYVSYLELVASRPEFIRNFEREVTNINGLISEIEYWLRGELPNYQHALIRIHSALGHYAKHENETIQDKLDYYKDCLQEIENDFWNNSVESFEWTDYEDKDPDDFIDPLHEFWIEWISYYNRIKEMHGIIEAQISMNEGRFKPKQ